MKLQKDFPNVTKYMGSKTEVLDLIEEGFEYMNRNYAWVCDLFSGSATLAGALRNRANVISNDVQKYSSVFAKTYLNNYNWGKYPSINEITDKAIAIYDQIMVAIPEYAEKFDYHKEFTNRRLTLVTSVMRYRRHFFVCRKQRIFSYYIIQAEKGDVRIMHTLRHVRTKH